MQELLAKRLLDSMLLLGYGMSEDSALPGCSLFAYALRTKLSFAGVGTCILLASPIYLLSD